MTAMPNATIHSFVIPCFSNHRRRGWFLYVCLVGFLVVTNVSAFEEVPCDAKGEWKGQEKAGSKGGDKKADRRNKSPQARVKHGGPGVGRNFKVLDVNGDGFLSFEEFSQSARLSRIDEDKRRKLFDFLDRNEDGKIHTRELRHHEPRWLVSLRKAFNQLDTDQSRGLDFDEFSKAPQLPEMEERDLKRIFKRLDRNNDQSIDRSELKGPGGPGGPKGGLRIDLKKYDTNQSGGVDFDEYSRMPWMGRIPEDRRKKLFEKLDRNKNGEISPEEVKAAWSAHGKCGPPHGRPHRGGPPHQKLPHDGLRPRGKGAPEGGIDADSVEEM